jgi:hypothetical protein
MNTQSHTHTPVPTPFGDISISGMDEFVPAAQAPREATSAEADESYRIGAEAADMQANRDPGWRAHFDSAPDRFYAHIGHGMRMEHWIAKKEDALAAGDWDLFIRLNGMAG